MPIGASISPEMKENRVVIKRERSKLVNMKPHIMRSHQETKHLIREKDQTKISRITSSGGLKNDPNRVFIDGPRMQQERIL